MLLRFGVSNYLSIKDRQELSLVASSLKDDESGLITPPATVKARLLPAAVIYGANASGKSNVVKALSFMRSFALSSHSKGEPGKSIGVTRFALDPDCTGQCSAFDLDFIAGGKRFAYSFSVTREAVESEELVAYPHSRPQLWFMRKGQEFSFGKSFTGRNRVIADLVRPNSLFLSAAAQNDHEMLKVVMGFFVDLPMPLNCDDGIFSGLVSKWHREIDDRAIKFLGEIGSGVVGQDIKRPTLEESQRLVAERMRLIPGNSEARRARYEKIYERPTIQFAHEGKGGIQYFFDFHQESTGTQRLLILLEQIFKSLDAGSPLIIDEIEVGLHSKASEALVALFISPKTNPRGAQLIVTTHDTNLMRSPLLRRDQIWIMEKNREGASELSSLSDFRTRSTDDFEKAYLQGRFGGTPYVGLARDLVELM